MGNFQTGWVTLPLFCKLQIIKSNHPISSRRRRRSEIFKELLYSMTLTPILIPISRLIHPSLTIAPVPEKASDYQLGRSHAALSPSWAWKDKTPTTDAEEPRALPIACPW